MASGIKEENLSLALRYIVDNFGKNTLLNAKKVESILSDLLPKSETDINWAVDAINLGIIKILLDENIVDDRSRKEAIQRAQDVFKRQYVAELRMDYILDNLSYALGWNNTKVDNLNDYELKRKSKPSKKIQLKKEEKKTFENVLKKPTVEQEPAKPIDSTKNPYKNEEYHENFENSRRTPNPINSNKFDSSNKNNKNNKKLLLLLLIPIIIIVLLIGKLFAGSGDVVLADFYFNADYDMQGSTYVFEEGKDVELNITLDADDPDKIDGDKISYSVDDTGVCYFTKKTDTKCILMGMSEGSTSLHIYYDGKEIDSLDIGFGEIAASNEPAITNVSVEQIHMSSNMSKSDGSYILPLNENSQIQVVLNGDNVDYSKLTYTIDDSSVASISGSGKTCEIYAKSPGNTSLRILYAGEEIDSILLSVKEEEKEEEEEEEVSDTDDDYYDEEQVRYTVEGYLANYSDALAYGDIYYVSSYLTSSGKLHKELSTSIPKTYDKGTQVDVIGYRQNSMKKENGHYRVGMTIEYNVFKTDETNYQREYMEFIVVQKSGQWLIDRYENWEMLEQYEI